MLLDLAQIKEEFTRSGILMCFNGSFTHDIIESLANAIRMYLANDHAAAPETTDVFAVFVEQAQNVRNYTSRVPLHDRDSCELRSAIVAIGRRDDGKYWICSGNYIAREDAGPLIARLDELNSLDKAGARKLYKTQLRKELPPDATSAGLGLIDIARRMSEPFQYEIREVNERVSFYTIRATI